MLSKLPGPRPWPTLVMIYEPVMNMAVTAELEETTCRSEMPLPARDAVRALESACVAS